MKYKDITTDVKIRLPNMENIFDINTDEDGFYYYNLSKTVYIPTDLDNTSFIYYTTKEKQTWTTIAYEFYNNVTLWWLVCSTNQIMNPVKQPTPGTIIKILKPELVTEIINKLQA